jgi:hypothetical protein
MSLAGVSVGWNVERSAGRRCSTHLCRNGARSAGRDCLACHAEWMREHRTRHSDLPTEQRQRANARSYVHVLLRRGKLQRGPCADCGLSPGEDVRPRHDDYTKPRAVRWACDRCERRRRAHGDQAKAS